MYTSHSIFYKSLRFVVMVLIFAIVGHMCAQNKVFAETSKTEVSGKVYELGKDSEYKFSDSNEFLESDKAETYGTFSLSGEISDVTINNGVPAYKLKEGNLKLFYNYGDQMLNNQDIDTWHIVEDKSRKVNDVTLNEDVLKGAIIVQTSKDRLNWVNVATTTNAFSTTPIRTDSIYETTDIQLINGSYYRIIVAYELDLRIEASNFLFINTDKFDYKKIVEVYEFYADTDTTQMNAVPTNESYNLGKKVRVANFDSYSGEEAIGKDDIHYGWDLGNFFVNGYTDKVKTSDESIVFLKNVGDKVTLWFRLNQDINKLNGKDQLSITADGLGSDQYFETPTMNFGRGTLIVRYTGHNNVKSDPTIYTNYLEANTSVGADTKVQLFEEGDYEVALDYQVTDDQLLDTVGHYRIFFKFSIRNGNSMVYPFDVITGSELTNSSMTDNGFRLDLAKSRYLKINLKKEMLTETADGLVEDTRFNGPAKDGATYTEEGIYNITVTNEYTDQVTTKKIYVGKNHVLKAHMATGLPIAEINSLVAQGATIGDDGMIQLATSTSVATSSEENKTEEKETSESSVEESSPSEEKQSNGGFSIGIAGGVITLVIIVAAVSMSKRSKPTTSIDQSEETKGGTE